MIGKLISHIEATLMRALVEMHVLSARQCLSFALRSGSRLRLVDILPFITLAESAEGNHSYSNQEKTPLQATRGSFEIINEHLGIYYEKWKSLNMRINHDEPNYYCSLLQISDDNLVRRLLVDLFLGSSSERNLDSLRELIVAMPHINGSNDTNCWRVAVNLCGAIVTCHSFFQINGRDLLNALINNRSDGIYLAMAGFLSVADVLNWDWQAKRRITNDKHYRETRKLGRWLRRRICGFPASERDKALRFYYKNTPDDMVNSYNALILFGERPKVGNNLELLILRLMIGLKCADDDLRISLALSVCVPGRVNLWRWHCSENNATSFLAQRLSHFHSGNDIWQNLRIDLGSIFYRYRMTGDDAGFIRMARFSYLNLGLVYWRALVKIGKADIAAMVRAVLLEDSESFKAEDYLIENDFLNIYSSLRSNV